MSLTLVTPPAVLPLSLAEAKVGAGLEGMDGDSEDARIMGYLRSAVASIDGRDGGHKLALITQEWDYKIDWFPVSVDCNLVSQIRLPLSPVQSITSIQYVDLAGATQTLSANVYQLAGAGDSMPKVVPAWGQSWPDARDQPEAVTVRFVAGYGDDWNSVPEPIRHALTLMVAEAYDGCESDAPMRLLNAYIGIKRPGPLPDLRRRF